MFSSVNSVGLSGIDSYLVRVETDTSQGLPSFDIVGLPDTAVKESRDRVRSALKNCGYDFPVSKITVNLAPADLKKAGPVYDLPILLGILLASHQLNQSLSDSVFIGELSLSGEVRGVNGVLPMAIRAKELGFKRFYVPAENGLEASLIEGIEIIPLDHLEQLMKHLNKENPILPCRHQKIPEGLMDYPLDFAEVKGQENAKRALEIAAALARMLQGDTPLLLAAPLAICAAIYTAYFMAPTLRRKVKPVIDRTMPMAEGALPVAMAAMMSMMKLLSDKKTKELTARGHMWYFS